VRCDNGFNTLKIFHPVDILLVGSVKGKMTSGGGSVVSEGSSWIATDISEVLLTGECKITTLFSTKFFNK